MIDLLNTIPDVCDARLEAWLSERLSAIERLVSTENACSIGSLIEISGAEVAALCAPSPFGKYTNATFRRFAAALFCADLACYKNAADRVSFDRLVFVLHAFCEGFRLFALRDASGMLLPVGYTGIYPIALATFASLERADASLANRLIAPLAGSRMDQQFLYLFNYSIARPLRRTECSRRLVQSLASDVQHAAPRGLATITVSADGNRIAERFGMRTTGSLQFAGLSESVLTARFAR